VKCHKMRRQILIQFIVAISLIGCALPKAKPPVPEKIVEVPERERLVQGYLQIGKDYEDKGDLVEAFKYYKIALTVDPVKQEAIDSRNRVEMSLRNSAEEHYKAGLKFHKEGKYDSAQQQFLIALRLWPDYQEAVEILTSRKRLKIKRYVVHTVKPGESLSMVAKIYYGDYHKFPVIAEYNNLTDATKVEVGDMIKVPVIEGVEFLAGKESIKTEEMESTDSGFWREEDQEAKIVSDIQKEEMKAGAEGESEIMVREGEEELEAEVQEEEGEPVDQVVVYRNHGVDLFNKKKYQEAVVVFNKVLKENPEDSLALEYSYKASFEQGMLLFDKKDYMAAKDKFEACLQLKSDCQQCHTFIQKSEDLYKEMHYTQGIQFFNKQLLPEAIKELELVKVYDNNYKRVNYLLKKAKTILKNMEELKEDQGNKLE